MIQTPDFADARRGLLLGLALLLVLTLFAACDSGDNKDIEPTTNGPEATAKEASTPDDSLTLPVETGEDPVYWRTQDDFQSIRVGEPYKVVLRVTNGYDEETLDVVSERQDGGRGAAFVATRAEPVSLEDPGTFYVFELQLPQPGRWQVTAFVGDEEDTITVQVKPARPSTD